MKITVVSDRSRFILSGKSGNYVLLFELNSLNAQLNSAMDRFDERILLELKADGRVSNIELSERIGLSPSATLRRVQELEKNTLNIFQYATCL